MLATNGVTVSPGGGGSLTFDNLGSNAGVLVTAGNHTIAANTTLADSLTVLYYGAGSLNLGCELGIPPDMIGIERDAERTGPAGVELVTEVKRLLQRIDAGAIRCLHGMQRLDRKRHPDAAGIVQ